MKHRLVGYFRRISPLSDEEAQAILDSMVVKTCPKGTHLLMAGQVCTEAYFVLQGCVRQYYVVDGEERSNGFFTEDEWVLSITPEQRYLKLSKTRPDIIQRIPQYQLASYIGVKPESLSRIRKRIATRGKPATPRRKA